MMEGRKQKSTSNVEGGSTSGLGKCEWRRFLPMPKLISRMHAFQGSKSVTPEV